MIPRDKIFRAVVLTGMGLVTTARKRSFAVVAAGRKVLSTTARARRTSDMNNSQAVHPATTRPTRAIKAATRANASGGGKDGFPMEGPPM